MVYRENGGVQRGTLFQIENKVFAKGPLQAGRVLRGVGGLVIVVLDWFGAFHAPFGRHRSTQKWPRRRTQVEELRSQFDQGSPRGK